MKRELEADLSIDLHYGFRAVSIDVITDFAFGKSYNLLEKPDLGLQFFTMIHKLGPAAWFFRQWPWMRSIVFAAPEKIIRLVSEPLREVFDMKEVR